MLRSDDARVAGSSPAPGTYPSTTWGRLLKWFLTSDNRLFQSCVGSGLIIATQLRVCCWSRRMYKHEPFFCCGGCAGGVGPSWGDLSHWGCVPTSKKVDAELLMRGPASLLRDWISPSGCEAFVGCHDTPGVPAAYWRKRNPLTPPRPSAARAVGIDARELHEFVAGS